MGYTAEQAYWIWLASVPGMSGRRFDRLLQAYGSPRAVWENLDQGAQAYLGTQAYAALRRARTDGSFDGLFAAMEREGIVAITRSDVEYPLRLRAIVDAPPALFVRGRVSQADARAVAIVGARNCTAYGTRMARRIARELSQQGVTVVSGLARGIDSMAHRGAIDAGARTVSVLGSGVDVIYPPEHLMMAEEILATGGSIVSEFPPGASPLRHHFPARNRVISGMCEGVLLIEGTKKSGAMSTVAFAVEQGREVFALPGQADAIMASGPLSLLRDGARLVACAEDILEDLGWQDREDRAPGVHYVTSALPMTHQEQRVYNLLAGGPVGTDELVEQLQMPAQDLGALLTVMELQGIVRMLPGRQVERI